MTNPIRVGWAKRSLAPEKGAAPITGQFHLRVALGVYTPVLANVLALDNGEDAVIFISADMVSVSPEVLTELQQTLRGEAPQIPADKIIINATHTHAGPSDRVNEDETGRPAFPCEVEFLSNREVRTFLVRQLADAVREAWEKRREGSVAYGYGFAATGHSRRTIYLDDIGLRNAAQPGIAVNGHGMMYGKTDDEMFDCYEAGTDCFINLFYTFDAAGKLTGAVVNVPCPSQTGEHAWVLHASFWHKVREKLAAKYGDIGVVGQAAAAGDLSPRQLHYLEAEKRRYRLKYADKIAEYRKHPMTYPPVWVADPEAAQKQMEYDTIEWMRAEDIANRIVAAFDEVLSWAGREKFSAPVLKHEVRTLHLTRRMFPEALAAAEKKNYEAAMREEFLRDGDPVKKLIFNSRLCSRRNRCQGVAERFAIQDKEPCITTEVHVVRIGDIAFASNRFELFMDYMHRIQARSPFEQTFIVQLVTDRYGSGSYLATERAVANKGYSASPYCNLVGPEGGQELVNATLELLGELKK